MRNYQFLGERQVSRQEAEEGCSDLPSTGDGCCSGLATYRSEEEAQEVREALKARKKPRLSSRMPRLDRIGDSRKMQAPNYHTTFLLFLHAPGPGQTWVGLETVCGLQNYRHDYHRNYRLYHDSATCSKVWSDGTEVEEDAPYMSNAMGGANSPSAATSVDKFRIFTEDIYGHKLLSALCEVRCPGGNIFRIVQFEPNLICNLPKFFLFLTGKPACKDPPPPGKRSEMPEPISSNKTR